MSILNNFIVDYNLISNYDTAMLKELNILPLKKDQLFTIFAVSKIENDLSFLAYNNEIIKQDIYNENEILFLLDDINIKTKIYNIYLKCLNEEGNRSYIKEFMDLILEFSKDKRASDIHIECEIDLLVFRFRIDGILKIFFNFDIEFYLILSSYIKLISNLDITQRRIPQNGRLERINNSIRYDYRISTMPTVHGESIVLRALDNIGKNKKLDELGFSDIGINKLKKSINTNNGLILITGPTGSGKSTTLYSILNELNKNEKKIITIEDPVEYKIQGIQQVNINNEIGLKFEDVLKNILRQDPDVIMIGEIRDEESLNIAIQASLTGHLVLSTLHTNDTVSTISRLFDLKAKPYLVATTLKTILAQRLVLRLCVYCKDGCPKCNYTKYHGRISIFETLEIDEVLSSMIAKNSSKKEIKEYLEKHDFISLEKAAKEKVKNGITTLDEIRKVLL